MGRAGRALLGAPAALRAQRARPAAREHWPPHRSPALRRAPAHPTAHRRAPALCPVSHASRPVFPRPTRRRRRKELPAPAVPRRTMPRIDADLKLDFKDVLLRPKRSSLKSRAEVRLLESRFGRGIFFRVARRGRWKAVTVVITLLAFLCLRMVGVLTPFGLLVSTT